MAHDMTATLIQELEDSKLYEYINQSMMEIQELEARLSTVRTLLRPLEFEAEMRRIAGSHEELKAFRNRLQHGTKSGRTDTSKPNVSNAGKPLVNP